MLKEKEMNRKKSQLKNRLGRILKITKRWMKKKKKKENERKENLS